MKILKSILNYIPLATFIIFVVTDGIFSLISALIFVISTIGLLINWKRKKTEMKNWEYSSLLGRRRERKIGIWRRFLFMKKGINKSILFYVVSALFLIASAIGLTTGNENTMAIIWLSLGSAFLCLGSTYKKKENNKTNTDDK